MTYGGQFENLVQAKAAGVACPLPCCSSSPHALLRFWKTEVRSVDLLRHSAFSHRRVSHSGRRGVCPFSISAGVGFVALFGVAVLNRIVLISEFNRLKNQGMHELQFLIMEGTRVRLQPVLMTASVASLGFTHGAEPGCRKLKCSVLSLRWSSEVCSARPFLTLVVLPVLYLWMEREKPRKKKSAAGGGIAGTDVAECLPRWRKQDQYETTLDAKRWRSGIRQNSGLQGFAKSRHTGHSCNRSPATCRVPSY